MIIFLILAILLLSALIYWYYRQFQTDAVYDRLSYGFPEPEEIIEEDLTDPAFGLKGWDKTAHNISYFLTTWKGKLFTVAAGAGLGYIISRVYSLSVDMQTLTMSGLATLLFFMGVFFVNRRARKRKKAIKNELPYALEMLAALMKGGLAFETSLRYVIQESDSKHPLYFELSTMFESMQRGRRRTEAFRLLAQRCNVGEVTELASAAVQVDQTGGSLGDVMRHHAKTIFRENEAEIRLRAEKLPVKLMFPMILTIFPSLFVVLLLPNLLRILGAIDSIMGRMQ